MSPDASRGTLIIDRPDLTLDELEREYILKVLSFTGWQKKRASDILGINASTLYRKLQAYKAEGLLAEGQGPGPEEDLGEEDVFSEAA